MCLVANGHDGNGLQFENFWQIFASLCTRIYDKTGKKLIRLVVVVVVVVVVVNWSKFI